MNGHKYQHIVCVFDDRPVLRHGCGSGYNQRNKYNKKKKQIQSTYIHELYIRDRRCF